MTRDDWLARCAAAWDAGYVSGHALCLLKSDQDMAARLAHTLCSHGQSQGMDFVAWLREEMRRQDNGAGTLANDADRYQGTKLLALLSHHCQQCATDRSAWHTRPGFCNHKWGE